MVIRDLAGAGARVLEPLGAALARVRTLGDLLDWGRSQAPRVTVEHVVTQDEFTHDALVPHGRWWLAFDVT
jgi:hypothetical protein